jgi:hypothetical protein
MEHMRDDTFDQTQTSNTFAPQPSHNRDTSVGTTQDDNVLEKSDLTDEEWKPDEADEETEIESSEFDLEHADSSLDDRPLLDNDLTESDESSTEKFVSTTSSAGM